MILEKTYLGDGVYFEIEYGVLKLTTENGLEVTNTIYLEPFVFENLEIYRRRAIQAAKDHSRD